MIQIQTDRVNSLLAKICLTKFTYKQTKSLESLQHRNLGQTKSPLKFYQITLTDTFSNDALVTQFEIELNQQSLFQNVFQFGNAEASIVSNRGNYIQMVNLKSHPIKNKSIIIDACAFTQSIKFVLNIKKDFQSYCQKYINFKKQKIKNIQEENITKALLYVIKSINIYGFTHHSSPLASQLTKLLNVSQSFKKCGRDQESAETDILVAMSLINARRFIQASELLRKASNYFTLKYVKNKSNLQLNKYEKSWIREYDDKQYSQSLNMSRNYSTGRVLEGGKFLFKAAKIQLILAETISHPSLINEKLQAYNRANSYFNGNPNPTPLDINSDIQQVFFSIGPNLIVFLIKVLYDKIQILRITALKSIEFIFQTLGCSLSKMMPQIMKIVIATYPSDQNMEFNQTANQLVKQKQKDESKDNKNSKNKLLIDHYHHLLQTFLGLLTSMNKKYLRSIFTQVILPNISSHLLKNQLKLYLLRFSQKILSLCGPDIQITVPFITKVINVYQKKFDTNSSKHTIHNMVFFSTRILDIIKNKILNRYDNQNIGSICMYINQNLVYFCQNEITTGHNSFFTLMIDFIISIYNRKLKYKVICPIQPIIYFLNISIHQPALPFDKILQVTIVLLKYLKEKNQNSEICQQIISRILTKSKLCTLTIKQLKILQQVLKIVKQIQSSWIQQFLYCIPHSTFDQTYYVFNALISKLSKNISKNMLQKIINTFLDQYTVKGKAHQSSKQKLINSILLQNHEEIKSIVQICLTENNEPLIANFYARKSRKNQHILDSKMFKTSFELFTQKLDLLIFFLAKVQQKPQLFYTLMTQEFILQIYKSLKSMLDRNNTKLKQKVLKIIKCFIEILGEEVKQGEISKNNLFFCKSMLTLLKGFIAHQSESKLHFNALLNISLIFKKFFTISEMSPLKQNMKQEIQNQNTYFFMDGYIESQTKFQLPKVEIKSILPILRFREFMKIYPPLINLINSPWQNIRKIIIQIILQFFVNGLVQYRQNYQIKAIQILKPALANFLISNDFTERMGGVKILGCLIGMAKQYKNTDQMKILLSKTSKKIKFFIESVYLLQNDWNQTISSISKAIIEISLSAQQRQLLRKRIMQEKKGESQMQNSYCSFNLGEEFNLQKSTNSFSMNNFDNLQSLLKEASRIEDQDAKMDEGYVPNITPILQKEINTFKIQISKIQNIHSSFFGDRQSYLDREEDHFLEPNQDKADSNQDQKQQKSDEQPLQFQDLGIIDLDDQEWGQQQHQNQVQITQKLPLKKIYKLSPNVGGSSKHQRIRSKRYFSHQFDQNDKIIVDELEGKINHQPRVIKKTEQRQIIIEEKPNRLSPKFQQKRQEKQKIQQRTQGFGFKQFKQQQKSQQISRKPKKSMKKRKSSALK